MQWEWDDQILPKNEEEQKDYELTQINVWENLRSQLVQPLLL